MTDYYELCQIPLEVAAAVRANVGIPAGVRIALHITQETIPVEGNASAINEVTDAAIASAILVRLCRAILEDRYDTWAWCTVRVTCTDGDAEGTAYLGGCSYEHTADFLNGGYFEQLTDEAFTEYQGEVARLRAKYALTKETSYA